MKMFSTLALTLGVMTSPASAAPILGLYNTGVTNSGTALAGGDGVTDTHYRIVASSSSGFVGNNAVTYYNGNYIADSATSRWVSLSRNGTPGNGTSTYHLTFDLTGYDAASASIMGGYAVDNLGSVSLNGGPASFGTSSYTVFRSFSFTSGFVAGVNTLDFTVIDQGQPTALRVDSLSGTANLITSAVPEPATWAMMIVGFGMVGGTLRRRRTTVRFAD